MMEDNIKILKSVLKQWKIILASSVLMAVVMYMLTTKVSKEYESNASIYTGITTGEGIVGGKTDFMLQSSSYDNLVNIIQGRETLKEVGLRLLAMHMNLTQADQRIISYEKFEDFQKNTMPEVLRFRGATDSITFLNLIAEVETNPYLNQMINSPYVAYYSIPALSSVWVHRQGISDMISMSYRCDDPGISQKTLEILIDVCIRNWRQLREGQTDKKVAFFEDELQRAQAKLKRAEAKEELFKREYDIVDLPIQTGMAITDRQELDKQIAKESENMTTAKAGIRQIESQLGTQAQSMKRTDILRKQEQLALLLNQLTTAELNNSPPSRIASLNAQIEKIKEDLSSDYAEVFTPATTGKTSEVAATEYFNRLLAYEESRARLRALENRRNTATVQFNKHLPLADSLRRIQREIEICEKEYLAALDLRNQSVRQQLDLRSYSNIQVYKKPNFPLTGKSKRKMILIMGTMMGFMIPTCIFLGLAYLNSNIQTPKRAEEMIGLKSVGIIPNMKKLQDLKKADIIINGLIDTILKSLYMTHHRTSQIRILIISTRPGEGKTEISNLLCERLNAKGRKCLVVAPYIDSDNWSVVSYKVDKSFYDARADDIVPLERINDADILIIELPPLIMNDYPVDLIRQFDMAFLICRANREWVKADQTALDSFIKISGIDPKIILNDVEIDIVEEILGKISS